MARLALILLAVALGACNANLRPAPSAKRIEIVSTALAQIGKPYRYAGADPEGGFDCSGLVHYSYAQSGLRIPRSTQEQLQAGEMVSYEEAQPGDLLFYQFDQDKKASSLHVILFTGDGSGVHAPVSGKQVSAVRVGQPAWTSRYVGTVSLLGHPHITGATSARAAASSGSEPIRPPRAVEPAPAIDTVQPRLMQPEQP